MPRKFKTERSSGYTILLVDDDHEYLEATRLLLERDGHRVLTETNGPAALEVLHKSQVDLLLLDYFMPGMTGEEVVTQLRQFNPYVQVILQTGYASEQPPRDLLKRLDIQGYYDKSEGPDKLLLWVDAGLKSAFTIQLLNKSRQGLRYILDITPDLHRIQPLDDLLQGILWQVAGLLGAVNSFLAVILEGGILRSPSFETEGFLAMLYDTELVIHASTGRFAGRQKIEGCLESEMLKRVRETVQRGEIQIVETSTIVPLHVGELTIGVVYLDRPAVHENDKELLHVFANQAAVAIQNTQLYEMATLDPLTEVYTRRFFDQWLLRSLRTVFRSQQVISLLMLDLDSLKRINDVAGHLAGDEALTTLGKVLREVTRSSSVVGRYGGDEFAIIMPQTSEAGAERAGQRILESLRDKHVVGSDGPMPIQVSVGAAVLNSHTFNPADIPHPVALTYFEAMAQDLIRQADEALYQAKREGGNRICRAAAIEWPSIRG